ncbi:MAG: hypothetical protein R2702_14460 [Acidimicrobiales bacterium]
MSDRARRVLAADPFGRPNLRLVAAAARAGGIGILDVAAGRDLVAHGADLRRRGVERWWLRPGAEVVPADVAALAERPEAVLLAGDALDDAALAGWREVADDLVVEVTSRAEADAAIAAGATGLVASGSEAGGRVGDTEASILFQHLVDLGVPVWARGGIGRHTAAAVLAGGGAGVVLDGQLALLREVPVGDDLRRALTAMDGSETRVVGGHRFLTRPDLPAAALPDDSPAAEVASFLGDDPHAHLVPVGQDAGFAAGLAERYVTVGGVVQAVQATIDESLALAQAAPPMAPGAGVAPAHGTLPDRPGPDDPRQRPGRVRPRGGRGGGLPFLALALLRGPECATCSCRPRSSSATARGASACSASCPPTFGPSSSRWSTRWRRRSRSSRAVDRARPRRSRRPASAPTSTSRRPGCSTAS